MCVNVTSNPFEIQFQSNSTVVCPVMQIFLHLPPYAKHNMGRLLASWTVFQCISVLLTTKDVAMLSCF